MPTLIRIGHPPRGRRKAPYGWPEKLCDLTYAVMIGLFVVGCTMN